MFDWIIQKLFFKGIWTELNCVTVHVSFMLDILAWGIFWYNICYERSNELQLRKYNMQLFSPVY